MAGERRRGPKGPDGGRGDGFWGSVLPDTALGLATLLFFMAIAAAFSGAALFAYYRFELDETRQRVAEVEGAVADQVASGEQIIGQRTEQATSQIEALLGELEQYAASGQTVEELVAGVAPSVFFVSTLDEAGQPSVGTAFVLFSDSERSFLLTSYETVRAATVAPGPAVEVRQGDRSIIAELSAWDEARDLALLVAEQDPNLPAVTVADPSSLDVGDRVFAVSGLGTAGGAVTQGVVADVAANGIQHDASIGPQFQGGPLLDADGQLAGITSRRYAPLGFLPDDVYFAVPVREACAELVSCPAELD